MEVPAKLRSALVGFRYWLLALIFMATSTFLVACGGGGTTTVISPTPTTTTTTLPIIADTLTLTASSNVVFANTIVTITAYAKNGTRAVVGEMITFEITTNDSGSDLNGFQIVTAETSGNGKATVTYTAGNEPPLPQTDTITATSTTETATVNITVNPLPANLVVVSAPNPDTTLDADGADRTLIEALVTDTSGTEMEGAVISFTTTAGDICASGTLVSDPCNAAQPLSATTGSDGIARVILQSSTNLETATVEATTTNFKTGSVDVEFIAGPAGIITLQANPANITADNGISTSTVTALVTDSEGHIVADGVSVTFSVLPSSDPNTGSFPFGSPPVGTVGGLASQTFTAGSAAGNVDVLAAAGSVDSGTDGDNLITLITQVVGSISLSFVPDNILTADGVDYTEVRATLLDIDGNPMNAGVTVSFATTGGGLDLWPITAPAATQDADTNASGVATVYLESSTVAGNYFVSAASGSKVDIASVQFVPGLADDTNSGLTVNPVSILANGFSTAVLTLDAKDANNNVVVDGTSVAFTSSAGSICDYPDCLAFATPLIATTTNGIARAIIQSSETPAAAVTLSANMTGFAVPVTETMAFTLDPSTDPNSIQLVLSGGVDGSNGTKIVVESPGGSAPALITANVTDGYGNAIRDCTGNIEFRIISGPVGAKLDGTTTFPVLKSTVNGSAAVSLTAGTDSGTVRVEAKVIRDSLCATGFSLSASTTPIVIASGEAANLLIYPYQNVVDNQDGTISQMINALVTDSFGNPVEDGTAVFLYLDDAGNDFGTICAHSFTGDPEMDTSCSLATGSVIKGVAHSMLTWVSEGIFQPFEITAETETDTYGTVVDTYASTYPAVAPISIDVTIIPSSAPGGFGGPGGISVTAEYTDGALFSNPISGRVLDFTSSSAFATIVTPSDTTDINGFASTTVTTSTCRVTDTIVTITASDPPYSGSSNMTIEATEPTALFTVSGTAPIYTFSNTSIRPSGYNYSYSWDFGDGTCPANPECDDQNPTHTYSGVSPVSYTATLTVTNDDAPGSCSDTSGGTNIAY